MPHHGSQVFIRHGPQRVHHRDVTEATGDGQGSVPILTSDRSTGSYSRRGGTQRTFSIMLSVCVCACASVCLLARWPRWARWLRLRAEAAGWWCGCGPAGLPGVVECTRSRKKYHHEKKISTKYSRLWSWNCKKKNRKTVFLARSCFPPWFCRWFSRGSGAGSLPS